MFRQRWADLVRQAAASWVDVLRAEIDELLAEFGASGKAVGRAAVAVGIAAFAAFWAVAVLAYTLVEVVHLWWPRWAAALAAFGFLGLVALVAGLVARHRFRSADSPRAIVRRRTENHVAWLRGTLEPVGTEVVEEEAPE